MINLNAFAEKVAATRASRVATQTAPGATAQPTAQSPASPAQSASLALARSASISWTAIADELNHAAGFAHAGPNVDPAAARSKRGHAPDLDRRLSQPSASDAAWNEIAAALNDEAGLTPNRSTGA